MPLRKEARLCTSLFLAARAAEETERERIFFNRADKAAKRRASAVTRPARTAFKPRFKDSPHCTLLTAAAGKASV